MEFTIRDTGYGPTKKGCFASASVLTSCFFLCCLVMVAQLHAIQALARMFPECPRNMLLLYSRFFLSCSGLKQDKDLFLFLFLFPSLDLPNPNALTAHLLLNPFSSSSPIYCDDPISILKTTPGHLPNPKSLPVWCSFVP